MLPLLTQRTLSENLNESFYTNVSFRTNVSFCTRVFKNLIPRSKINRKSIENASPLNENRSKMLPLLTRASTPAIENRSKMLPLLKYIKIEETFRKPD